MEEDHTGIMEEEARGLHYTFRVKNQAMEIKGDACPGRGSQQKESMKSNALDGMNQKQSWSLGQESGKTWSKILSKELMVQRHREGGRYAGAAQAPGRHPGDTQKLPKDLETPRSHPADKQRHPGTTKVS